jgi:DNA-directed RNA polymerase subunit H (RpoH/RPB5)
MAQPATVHASDKDTHLSPRESAKRSHATLAAMLRKRGYTLAPDGARFHDAAHGRRPLSDDEADELVRRGGLILRGTRPDGLGGREGVLAFLFPHEKTNVKHVRDVDAAMLATGSSVAVVAAACVTHPAVTEFQVRSAAGNFSVHIFLVDEVLNDITEHRLHSPHRALDAGEREALMRRYRLTEENMPTLLTTDAVARFYGWTVGTVVEVERCTMGAAPVSYYYRRVSDPIDMTIGNRS